MFLKRTLVNRIVMQALILAFGLPPLAAASAAAQTTSGVIEGTIRDPDGGAVPGVQIVVNSPALIQRDLSVTSNADGYYRVPSLPPGTYRVIYTIDGFRTVERTGLIVNAGQAATVDVELSLASVNESVTVSGESPTVDPTSTRLEFNYTRQLLENVPTTRQFHNIVTTIPGVETANPFGTSPGNLENESVLGAGPYGNRYNMDGGNITDPSISNNQANLFSADIIQEIQVLRGAKPAEVGFAQGGFFNIVTKSGGNEFSGEASAYYQGERLQSENIDERLRAAGVTRSNKLVSDPDFSVTAGGRIIRDRLWWFGSARHEARKFQLLGFDRDVQDTINAYFWKNTFQINPKHRVTALVNHWDEDVNYFFFGFSPANAAGPEVSMIRDPSGDAAQARWDGVLSPTVVADFSFGFNRMRLPQKFQENATVAIRDLVTGRRFGNPGNNARSNVPDNYNWSGSIAKFVGNALGRHNLKAGGEFTHAPFTYQLSEIEDHQLRLSNGAPSQVVILSTPVGIEWLQRYFSLYAQDSWTIQNRLTLNLGLRYDRTASKLPEQGGGGGVFANSPFADQFPALKAHTSEARDLWTWNSIAPRAAASFDLDSQHRTVLKAGFSRYYHHLHAQQVWDANPNFPVSLTYRWNDPNGDRKFQIGEEGTLLSVGGGGTTQYDPELAQPYSDEITVGLSRELFTDFSVNANFISRKDHDLMDAVNTVVPFSSYTPVVAADPGPDGKLNTGDDGTLTAFAQNPATLGTSRSMLTNPDRLGLDNSRDYRAFELIANKRLSNRWQFVGSFVVSRSIVVSSTAADTGAIGSVFRNPNGNLFTKGHDELNQTYQVKLQGTYVAPFDVVLSALHRYGSGFPYTRQLPVTGLPQGPVTVFAEPRGSRTTDSYNWFDVRAEKTFRFGAKRRVGLIVDVFNVANAATVLQVGTRTGVDFGVPRGVRNPRIVRLGTQISW